MQLLIIFLSIVLIFTILLLLFLMFRRRLFGGDSYRRKTRENGLKSSFVVHNKSYAPVHNYLTNPALKDVTVLASLGSEFTNILRSGNIAFPKHLAAFLGSSICELLKLAYRYERVDERILGNVPNTLFDTANAPDNPSETLRNEDYCRMILGYCIDQINQESQIPLNDAHIAAYRIQQSRVTVRKVGNTYSFLSIPCGALDEYQSMTIPKNIIDEDGYLSNGRDITYTTDDTTHDYILVTYNRRWAVWLTSPSTIICDIIGPSGTIEHRLTGSYYDSYTSRISAINKQSGDAVRYVYSLIMELDDENRTHINITNGEASDELPYLVYRGIDGDITNIDLPSNEQSYVSRASLALIYKDGRMVYPFKFIKIIKNNKMIVGKESKNGGIYLYKMDIQTRVIEDRLGHVIPDIYGHILRKNNTVIAATKRLRGIFMKRCIVVYDSDFDDICIVWCNKVTHNYYTGATTVYVSSSVPVGADPSMYGSSFTIDDNGVFSGTPNIPLPSIPNQIATYGSYMHELSKFIRIHEDGRMFINYVSVAASIPSTPQSFVDMFDSIVSGKITIDKIHADRFVDMGIIWDYNPHQDKQKPTYRSDQIRNARKLIIDLLFDPMVTITVGSSSTSMYKYQPKIYRDNRVKDIFITFVPCRDGDTIFPRPYGDDDDSIIFLETDEKQSSNKGKQVFYDTLIGAYYTGVPDDKRFINVATFRIHKDARAIEKQLNIDMIKHPHFLKSICHFLTIMKLCVDNDGYAIHKDIAYTYV